MSAQGEAYVIATAIYAGTKNVKIIDIDEAMDRLFKAVDALDWPDEKAADIYATLAERLQADTPFELAVTLCQSAIQSAEVRYG